MTILPYATTATLAAVSALSNTTRITKHNYPKTEKALYAITALAALVLTAYHFELNVDSAKSGLSWGWNKISNNPKATAGTAVAGAAAVSAYIYRGKIYNAMHNPFKYDATAHIARAKEAARQAAAAVDANEADIDKAIAAVRAAVLKNMNKGSNVLLASYATFDAAIAKPAADVPAKKAALNAFASA